MAADGVGRKVEANDSISNPPPVLSVFFFPQGNNGYHDKMIYND